jgi:hypothetical protein
VRGGTGPLLYSALLCSALLFLGDTAYYLLLLLLLMMWDGLACRGELAVCFVLLCVLFNLLLTFLCGGSTCFFGFFFVVVISEPSRPAPSSHHVRRSGSVGWGWVSRRHRGVSGVSVYVGVTSLWVPENRPRTSRWFSGGREEKTQRQVAIRDLTLGISSNIKRHLC